MMDFPVPLQHESPRPYKWITRNWKIRLIYADHQAKKHALTNAGYVLGSGFIVSGYLHKVAPNFAFKAPLVIATTIATYVVTKRTMFNKIMHMDENGIVQPKVQLTPEIRRKHYMSDEEWLEEANGAVYNPYLSM